MQRDWEASEAGETGAGAEGQRLNFGSMWASGCLRLAAEFPLSPKSKDAKRSLRKTNGRWRQEGVEANICVRLAGAR